ncbi:hypothetical protein [Lysinibacillus sphaericus]|uniref:Uncharacterized protein n=1 Tax=Lysinibacillus sphaericus OT4b.31 TaxID=1285586 RepID=R7Z832_LYSSH|nr:hypothetical protein [Lysinibacillus sphaericus]EON70312.1 hypothetical protein H131_21982 [Lysinibacillus sphaericus OT4b.31]
MINQVVVRIAAERIMSGGQNPKTNDTYVINDITNQDYKQSVEEYILMNTKGL